MIFNNSKQINNQELEEFKTLDRDEKLCSYKRLWIC
jgi:hypothetical protein